MSVNKMDILSFGILFMLSLNVKLAISERSRTFNEYISIFRAKNCSFPGPYFYDTGAVPEGKIPVLSVCKLVLPDQEPLLPLPPNLKLAKELCTKLLTFSEAMCAPDYKKTADTYLKTSAVVYGVTYDNTRNVCWFADKLPTTYKQYMPAFMLSAAECNQECTAPALRQLNVQGVCQLLVSTLCQFQTTWTGCISPDAAIPQVVAEKPESAQSSAEEASSSAAGGHAVSVLTPDTKVPDSPAASTVTGKPKEEVLAKTSNVSGTQNPSLISGAVKTTNGSTVKPVELKQTVASLVDTEKKTAVKPAEIASDTKPLPSSTGAAGTAKPTGEVVDQGNTQKPILVNSDVGKTVSPVQGQSGQSTNQTLSSVPSKPLSNNTEIKKPTSGPSVPVGVDPTIKPVLSKETTQAPVVSNVVPAESSNLNPKVTTSALPKDSGAATANPDIKTGEKVVTTSPPLANVPVVPQLNISEGRGKADETPIRGRVTLFPTRARTTPQPPAVRATSGSLSVKPSDFNNKDDRFVNPYESYNGKPSENRDNSFDVYPGNRVSGNRPSNTDYRSNGYGSNVQTQNHRVHALPGGQDSPGSGHFFAYFLTAVVLCISGYIIFHNKQKIVAFIVEGKAGGGGARRRSSGGVKYSQLKSSVEEVMPSLETATTNKNFVY